MTNKESIQAAHLERINFNDFDDIKAASDCTTITAEAIRKFAQFIDDNDYELTSGIIYENGFPTGQTIFYLSELFLNQKAKI